MIIANFNRMENPLDVQPGLDELPDFVPDEAYLELKSACAEAYVILNLQRTHRYSMAELKAVIDRYADLAHQADRLMRFYAVNDAFVYHYMDLCERYAELEAYLVRAQDFIARRSSSEFWTIKEVVQLRDAHSAMYDQVFFVTEFADFKWNYDWTQEAALFLELDTANARSAMWAENVSCRPKWIRRFSELFERINENLGLEYFYCCEENYAEEHFDVFRFKIPKTELTEMLAFQAKMGEVRFEHWKRRIS
jgi:hypothetical protein